MAVTQAGRRDAFNELDYRSLIVGRWLWIATPVLVCSFLAFYYHQTRVDVYRATAKVLLADTASQRTLDPGSQNTGFLTRELANEITLAKGDAVEDLVSNELGRLPDVTIGSDPQADVLLFAAKAATADAAARYANTWAAMYVRVKGEEAVENISEAASNLERRLEELRGNRAELRAPLEVLDQQVADTNDPEEIDQLRARYDRLSDGLRYELELITSQSSATAGSLTELELQAELANVGAARTVEIAVPPTNPSNTPLLRNLAPAVTFGLLVGAGLALLAELRDNTIKVAADVQTIADLPVLASIPDAGMGSEADLGVATYCDPEGALANGYHRVRSSIEFASLEGEIRSILITSANPREGKSTTASNLALASSSVGKKTVLVDVDYRRARIHEIYQIPQIPGLSDFILHDAELNQVAFAVQEDSHNSLMVIPIGTVPPSPAAFVGTGGFLKALDWMETEADLIVLDAPPLLAVSDPQTLGQHVDAVVLTALAGKTTKAELGEVVNDLRQVGAFVLGIVLIGVDDSETYGRQYYQPDRKARPRRSRSNTGLMSRIRPSDQVSPTIQG